MNCSSRIGAKLKVLSAAFGQEANRRAAEVGLTGSQAFFLGYLSRHRDQPVYPRDLEREFEFSHPTVSGILSRLEQKDFIRLETDPEDRRVRRIYVLPKGAECHDRMHRVILANEERMVQGFSPEEKAAFARLLGRAIENMGGCPCQQKHKEEDNQ